MIQATTLPNIALSRDTLQSSAKIHVISCGGRTGPGGIPRIVDYYMAEWESQNRWPPLEMIDSTGPSYDWRRQPLSEIWRQPFYCLRALAKVAGAGLLGRVAALHIHMAERGSVFRKGLFIYLGRLLRRPVIVHMHAASFAEFYTGLSPSLQRCVRHTLWQATRFIVLGNAQRQYFIDIVKLDPERVVVVHNAVPTPLALSRYSNNQQCQLLFVGTLIERKGLADLLDALAQSDLRERSWHLRIVGEGDQSRWINLIEAHGLHGRVEVVGWLPSAEVHGLLEASDVLVLPSHNEGLPIIILEAMAHGRPVVATPVGSVCDAVMHEVTGLVVPPSSPKALAHALERLIADPDFRRRLGQAARQLSLERFTISRLNDQLEKMFRPLCKKRSGINSMI